MTTFVFPGQGSQQVGMGAELFDQFSELTAKADDILGYSIKELCLSDANQQLNQTQYTQPALYVVNALSYLAMKDSSSPLYFAGHSLGEYDALFAAQAFDFATGLQLVKKRGELMSQATGGGMAAVLGLDSANIIALIKEHGFDKIEVANFNSSAQTVISGASDQIAKAKTIFEQAGAKRYMLLPVSGAFHSSYMQTAANEFSEFLNDFEFKPLQIPVIANVSAKPYQDNEIKSMLSQQITSSVRWVETIQYLKAQGETDFVEVGPGKVLTGLIKRI